MDIQLIALFVAPLTSIVALAYGIYLSRRVIKEDEGSDKLREIAKAVREGAMSYLNKQFKVVLPIMLLLAFLIWITLGFGIAVTFLLGAIFSAIIGYFGMWIAVRANPRPATAAISGLNKALKIAFGAGTVNGMLVVGLGLLGVSLIYMWSYFSYINLGADAVAKHATEVLVGYGFGAALLALFMRVGGGIFTKAADVGADLVGKVEKGIPEDDPRNPATIADNVGDNVGDVAGMGADLFGSYVATVLAAMVLGNYVIKDMGGVIQDIFGGIGPILLPMSIAGFGILFSIIGTMLVKLTNNDAKEKQVQNALNKGNWVSIILTAIACFVLVKYMLPETMKMNFFGEGIKEISSL